jgi:NADH:ubiquinone reductase (H+-translocating)
MNSQVKEQSSPQPISTTTKPHNSESVAPTRRDAVASSGPVAARTTSATKRSRVVIIGAGFGGLEAARALRNADVDVILIDRRNHHLFQPLLYQVATAALSPGDIAWPIRSIFRNQANVTVFMADITGVDPVMRTVSDGTTVWPYDFLILAAGASQSYFGHDEWMPYAPGLKSIGDATTLRQRFLSAFERAELAALHQRPVLPTTVVVGGGATGVEMAGAVAELARRTLRSEFRKIDPAKARIVLVEAGPRLLPSFPDRLSEVARRSLTAMHVEVRTDTKVTACDERGVTLGDRERIEAEIIFWAAGVQAAPIVTWISAEADHTARVRVQPDLSVPAHPDIFVIGDAATVLRRDGHPVPGVAPAAKQMGRYAGKLIGARVARRSTTSPFVYHHAGDLAIIGRKSALVSLGSLRLTGFAGWLFWSLAHIWFLIGFRSRIVVAFEWLWSYLTTQRGARLIVDRQHEPASVENVGPST